MSLDYIRQESYVPKNAASRQPRKRSPLKPLNRSDGVGNRLGLINEKEQYLTPKASKDRIIKLCEFDLNNVDIDNETIQQLYGNLIKFQPISLPERAELKTAFAYLMMHPNALISFNLKFLEDVLNKQVAGIKSSDHFVYELVYVLVSREADTFKLDEREKFNQIVEQLIINSMYELNRDESVQKSEAESKLETLTKKFLKEGGNPKLENIVQCLDAISKTDAEGERFILYCKVLGLFQLTDMNAVENMLKSLLAKIDINSEIDVVVNITHFLLTPKHLEGFCKLDSSIKFECLKLIYLKLKLNEENMKKEQEKILGAFFLNILQTKKLLSYLIKLEQCSHMFFYATELEDEEKVRKIRDYCSTKSVELDDFVKKLTLLDTMPSALLNHQPKAHLLNNLFNANKSFLTISEIINSRYQFHLKLKLINLMKKFMPLNINQIENGVSNLLISKMNIMSKLSLGINLLSNHELEFQDIWLVNVIKEFIKLLNNLNRCLDLDKKYLNGIKNILNQSRRMSEEQKAELLESIN